MDEVGMWSVAKPRMTLSHSALSGPSSSTNMPQNQYSKRILTESVGVESVRSNAVIRLLTDRSHDCGQDVVLGRDRTLLFPARR